MEYRSTVIFLIAIDTTKKNWEAIIMECLEREIREVIRNAPRTIHGSRQGGAKGISPGLFGNIHILYGVIRRGRRRRRQRVNYICIVIGNCVREWDLGEVEEGGKTRSLQKAKKEATTRQATSMHNKIYFTEDRMGSVYGRVMASSVHPGRPLLLQWLRS